MNPTPGESVPAVVPGGAQDRVSRGLHRRWRLPAGAALLCLVVAGLVVAGTGLPRPEAVRALVAGTDVGPLVAVAGAAALTLVFVPRSVVALLGGAVFGPGWGAVYVVAGATVGATVAFGIGAVLGREHLARWSAPRWRRARAWLHRRGFAAVVYARLLPMVPFGLLNYGFGAAGLRLWVFVPATVVGIAPSTVAYAALGRAALTSPLALWGAVAVAVLPPLVYALRRRTRPTDGAPLA